MDVEVRDTRGSVERIRARYAVGCDGGRSTVRELLGIGFPGTDATLTAILGDVVLADPPERLPLMERRESGSFWVLEFEPGWHRVITYDYSRVPDRSRPCTLDDLRASMLRIAGTDFRMHSPRWISSFGDAARQAESYRRGRVLLAGDAAHIHFPAGGQGLNTGMQDAANLGWKLAAVVRGEASPSLLDTYESERHPVAARVLQNTRAQTALAAPGPRTEALREIFGALVHLEPVTHTLAAMITALDVRYDMGSGDHPLLGLRMPDVDLVNDRVYDLLHAARPVLLDLGADSDLPSIAEGLAGGIDVVRTRCGNPRWTLPVLGEIDAPRAVLIRPDGHVAWVMDQEQTRPDGLRAALERWCGISC
ncbi:FAD-dependent monooxygenase [Microtetraspora fusca]|uniref:FAD-dependent monooxygenase n=1 Tax=Microtetraspora fusca TaxID=1997 RepID=A0ABW6V4A5_MICFU